MGIVDLFLKEISASQPLVTKKFYIERHTVREVLIITKSYILTSPLAKFAVSLLSAPGL